MTAKTLAAACLLVSTIALAEEPSPQEPPELALAQQLCTRYLEAVKAKKWAEAKKFLHPDTIKAIAERKRRLGREDHPMAPWYHEKASSYLKAFKVTGASMAVLGTVVVKTSEDNFQVEEKGMALGEEASYLLGKKGGKWYVVDKKRGESFTDDSIKLGYKGYFDKPAPTKTEEE